MNKSNKFFVVFLVAATLLSAGCASTNPASEDREFLANIDDSHPRAKLVIASQDLIGLIRLHDPIFRDVGQLTQTQVQLQSFSDTDLDLEYRFDWFDDAGFKVDAPSSWQYLSLGALGTETLNSVGKVPGATRITLIVKMPNEMFEMPSDTYKGTQFPDQ